MQQDISSIDEATREYVDTIFPLYSAYLSGMEYEMASSTENDYAAVLLTGTAPDFESAYEDIYLTENATQMMAYDLLDSGDNTEEVQLLKSAYMVDVIINGMETRSDVDLSAIVELELGSDGNYYITNAESLMPTFVWDPSRIPAEEQTEIVQNGLEILLDEGLISQEEYDESYANQFGEAEAYSAVSNYIENVAIPGLTGGQGAYGVDIRPTYIAGITYNISITEVTANGATAVVSGTVPDVDSAISGLNSQDLLVSVMTDAMSAAISSGSIGAGESTAISIATGMIISAVAGSNGVSFSSEIHLSSDGNGGYTVTDGAGVIPNNLGAINNYSLSDGEIARAASRALGSLYSSGRITEDEYIRYCAYV